MATALIRHLALEAFPRTFFDDGRLDELRTSLEVKVRSVDVSSDGSVWRYSDSDVIKHDFDILRGEHDAFGHSVRALVPDTPETRESLRHLFRHFHEFGSHLRGIINSGNVATLLDSIKLDFAQQRISDD